MREKWHAERGIPDPQEEKTPQPVVVAPKLIKSEKPPLPIRTASEVVEDTLKQAPKPEPVSEGMTKEQRYREKHKEELAKKARERRATKKKRAAP